MCKEVINTVVWSSEQQKGHAVQDKWPIHSSVSTQWIVLEEAGGRENWVD